MSALNKSDKLSRGSILYVVISLVLAASPIWLRSAILSDYDPADTMGSGGDIFAWFGMATTTLLLAGCIQITVLLGVRSILGFIKNCVVTVSITIWLISMVWVHYVGVG